MQAWPSPWFVVRYGNRFHRGGRLATRPTADSDNRTSHIDSPNRLEPENPVSLTAAVNLLLRLYCNR